MSNVVSFPRPVVSAAVIAALVKLGYLRQGQRHDDTAVERAIGRLRRDLCGAGVIREGDQSSGGKDAGQEEAARSTPPRRLMP
jgi:hypothetical protein